MEYKESNPCNKCEDTAKTLETFYRHATPEFRKRRVTENLCTLCSQPQNLLHDCMPLLRRGVIKQYE